MKKIISIFAILIAVASVSAQKEYDTFEIQVDGLGCPFCAYGLEKKFKEFKGIKKVSIDIETGDFQFQYPSYNPLSMDAVIAQVNKAGYTPKEAIITRSNGKKENFSSNTNKASSANTSQKIAVKGNCEMCKARIEASALSIDGITFASWDIKTKTLEYKSKQRISSEVISKKIASTGHDTETEKANSEIYNSLPPCCYYRKK